jgi:hypothetical protein
MRGAAVQQREWQTPDADLQLLVGFPPDHNVAAVPADRLDLSEVEEPFQGLGVARERRIVVLQVMSTDFEEAALELLDRAVALLLQPACVQLIRLDN